MNGNRTGANHGRIGRHRRGARRRLCRARPRPDSRVSQSRQARGAGHDIQKKFGVQCRVPAGRSDRPAGPAPSPPRRSSIGGLDVHYLVNNAGVGLYGKFATTDLDAELKMIQLNVDVGGGADEAISARDGRAGQRPDSERRVDRRVRAGPMDVDLLRDARHLCSRFREAIDYELKPNGITVTTLCPGPPNRSSRCAPARSARASSKRL